MTELEKALQELKEVLKEAGYEEAGSLMTMSEEKLDELFRRFKRDVRKRERTYSPNSNEYKSLNEQRVLVERIEKILRAQAMENSGLMLSGSAIVETPRGNTQNLSQQLEAYKLAKRRNDIPLMQKLYRDVAQKAEQNPEYLHLLACFEEVEQKSKERTRRLYDKAARSGNAKVAWELAKKSREEILLTSDMEKTYKELAVEKGHKEAVLEKARAQAGIIKDRCYTQDTRAAYLLFRKYLMSRSFVRMDNEDDRQALFYYYKLGDENRYDMLKESVTIPLRALIENPGSYTRAAQELEGHIYANSGRVDEAIELLLSAGTEGATEEIEAIFFSDYYNKNPKEQELLENHLENMLYKEDTIPEVREELFEWYGWRYETGRKMICDEAIAYAYYGKAASMGGWKKYENYRRRILGKRNRNEKIVFFEKVLDYEFKDGSHYTDVYLDLAKLYEEKNMYEKARDIYSEGSRYANTSNVRQQCQIEHKRCDDKFTKRQIYIVEAQDSYNQCHTSLIGQKRGGFERLRDMAKHGNTYAALRFAQVAEQEGYLKDSMRENFPSQEEIFQCYKDAAEAGEREAIGRMVDILEYGQLGQRKDTVAAERWRGRL